MNRHNSKKQKSAGLVSAICGSLVIGLPVIPLAASAVPASKVNHCPGIYYEEPYNSTRLVPQGCPPNAASRQLGVPKVTTTPILPPNSITPPLPENRSNAIATVMPMAGKVDVKLKNNTNAIVSYEAIGHTQRRFLAAGEEIVLQNLPTPVTITTVRQDKGLVDVVPLSSAQPGMLEVSLNESKQLDNNLGALRIQRDGQVFLN
ncbi:hypothetical protein [Allocoleopsis franciscana]|uniref:Uncharacterized protein n=1 Tax=Allocoleopsis franciscana PCC 7113 TaxID=1173027 RepID=K9WPG4_9CYAN|nr:hypothetical protein [Allocoleopsis franciscana]AFZ21696.1 hypothetical protein Mic7113_6102 [Allocoleopsis franciscana PCC 7113]